MSNLPFPIPRNSPFFLVCEDGSAHFDATAGRCAKHMPLPMADYANWTADEQANAAAVAYCSMWTKQPTWTAWEFSDTMKASESCMPAFAAARERMKGEGT